MACHSAGSRLNCGLAERRESSLAYVERCDVRPRRQQRPRPCRSRRAGQSGNAWTLMANWLAALMSALPDTPPPRMRVLAGQYARMSAPDTMPPTRRILRRASGTECAQQRGTTEPHEAAEEQLPGLC